MNKKNEVRKVEGGLTDKCDQFGKISPLWVISKIFGKLFEGFLVLGKILNPLCVYWANLHCCKCPMKNNQAFWSHWNPNLLVKNYGLRIQRWKFSVWSHHSSADLFVPSNLLPSVWILYVWTVFFRYWFDIDICQWIVESTLHCCVKWTQVN